MRDDTEHYRGLWDYFKVRVVPSRPLGLGLEKTVTWQVTSAMLGLVAELQEHGMTLAHLDSITKIHAPSRGKALNEQGVRDADAR